MDLSLIIVNWNSAELLQQCLGSVEQWLTGLTYEALVVDNCSDEADIRLLKRLEDRFPWVKFVYHQENVGFARANNLALNLASGKNVLLLNPDTLFISGGFTKLMQILEQKSVGMVSCKLLNADKSIQRSCFYFPRPSRVFLTSLMVHKLLPAKFSRNLVLTEKDHEQPQTPDWVLGAFMLLTKDTLKQLGGFDESIFMYGEDMDLCYRVKQLGLQIRYVPDFAIIHYGGCSGKQAWSEAKREVLIYKAIFYFYRKYFSPMALIFVRGCYALGSLLRLLSYGLGCLFPGNLQRGKHEMATHWQVFLTSLNLK